MPFTPAHITDRRTSIESTSLTRPASTSESTKPYRIVRGADFLNQHLSLPRLTTLPQAPLGQSSCMQDENSLRDILVDYEPDGI